MEIDTKQQQYIETIACFTTPHEVESAVCALLVDGFGVMARPEMIDDCDARTRFVRIWQPTSFAFAGDYDAPGAMAAIHAFNEKVEDIIRPLGGDAGSGTGFTDNPEQCVIKNMEQ